MHLQISTKEFLNELVRRFPERPPMVTGRVMGRILEVSFIFEHIWSGSCFGAIGPLRSSEAYP